MLSPFRALVQVFRPRRKPAPVQALRLADFDLSDATPAAKAYVHAAFKALDAAEAMTCADDLPAAEAALKDAAAKSFKLKGADWLRLFVHRDRLGRAVPSVLDLRDRYHSGCVCLAHPEDLSA